MKKYFLLTCIAALLFNGSKACDICGCGVGNSYIGILPEFSKHIFGLRYRYNSLISHVGVGGSTSYLTTDEKFRTLELWGGWNIGKKFRLMASVPYSFDEQVNQGQTRSKNGLGDISISGFYQLINSRKSISGNKLLVQSLWLGAALKLPTGKYNPVDKSASSESANLFQLGTGSTDFSFSAMYDIRIQDAGINATASYKINTTNKYEYQYGNKLSLNAQAYYKFRWNNQLVIAPNAGIVYEKAGKDLDHDLIVDISGGNLLMGTIGIETIYKNISIGANFQTPFSQDLANGIILAKNRAMVHISFLL